MKLYKINENEIIHELYGAKLTELRGYEALTDEEANKLYRKSYDKKLDRIKIEHDSIDSTYSAQLTSLQDKIAVLQNNDERSDDDNNNLNKLFTTLQAFTTKYKRKKQMHTIQ